MSTSNPTSATTVSKKLEYIFITHGDSYVGQALAMHIADQLDKNKGQLKTRHRAVLVLCQDKTKLKHLKKRGIKVKVNECHVLYKHLLNLIYYTIRKLIMKANIQLWNR